MPPFDPEHDQSGNLVLARYPAPMEANAAVPHGPARAPVLMVLVSALLAAPTLLAYNLPPSATFFNQAAAVMAWGVFGVFFPPRPSPMNPPAGLRTLLAALLILLAYTWTRGLILAQPGSLMIGNLGSVIAFALVCTGAASVDPGLRERAFVVVSASLLLAGCLSAGIGLMQVYAAQLVDGTWIAHSPLPGRAVGNLRQPNHLSTLLLWAIVSAIWLGERARWGWVRDAAMPIIALLLLFAVMLSGSRTGALSTCILAVWGLLDRRLSRSARTVLVAAPLAYALMWLGADRWARMSGLQFGGGASIHATGDVSSSRFAIWSNALDMIKSHPWFGVGFGEFNFAWTLTPFLHRPTEFFDHTHNLLLNFAVELGLPVTAVVIALLLWALFRATRNAIAAGRVAGSGGAPVERAALVMVLLVGVHSMLEYPLWYLYFLLPTAFALGLCLGSPPARLFKDTLPERKEDEYARALEARASVQRTSSLTPAMATAERSLTLGASDQAVGAPSEAPAHRSEVGEPKQRTRPLVIASMMLILAGLLALQDYTRVSVIFAPPANAASLAVRIADGRRSVLFSHHADYAAATIAEHPSDVMEAFKRAPHYLLDARLMIAWATALDEAGDTDRARYLAARLREFRNPQAEPFFAVCESAPAPPAKRPFQCDPPTRNYTYRDFR